MEEILADHLLALCDQYSAATNLQQTTIGRLCAGESNFFRRLKTDKGNFTIRKYDTIVKWFYENWPKGSEWPYLWTRAGVSHAYVCLPHDVTVDAVPYVASDIRNRDGEK